LLALAAAAPASPATEPTIEPRFRRAPAGPPRSGRRIALTLDACNGGFDRRIAEALIAHRARATIFLTADWIRANPEGLRLLRAHPDLFGFENHGARHLPAVLGEGRLWGLKVAGTLAAVRQEVADGAAAIQAATGTIPRWYRGATARYSPAALAEITRMGWSIAAFALNADEGASLPAAAVAARLAAARDGDVVIGHINQPARPAGQGWVQGLAALAATNPAWSTLDALAPRAA
jgi:peptidoglycan/xylan/chitin deacetylase (PgdA/CDA1 family)